MGLTAAQILSAVSEDIFHGLYLEPASSAVCAVFLSVGCGFFLWLRGYLGPGPAVFGLIFGIIMQAITLTIGPLFPYAYYGIGIIFYLPFICQLAINVACTFVVFPETLAHQFSDRLINVLTPLQTVIASQEPMLQANPRTEEWLKFKSVKAGLSREVSFGLVSGKDLTKILATMPGFVSFYEIVEKVHIPEYHGHHPSPLQSLHNALDHMHNPRDEQHIEEIITLLSTASSPLLDALTTATAHLITTIHTLKANDAVYSIFLPSNAAKHEAATAKTAEILKTLEDALSDYRDSRRLDVVRPFAPLFDPVGHREGAEVFEAPSHRGCFWAFSYQFSLIGWAMALIEVFRETAEIEKKRRKARVWTPDWAKVKFRSGAEDAGNEDERPTDVPGFQSTVPGFDRSVFSAARDPDYVPPSKRSHIIGVSLYGATHIFRRSDFWWGVKVALLIGLISLPAYFQSTAYFFYRERGVWVLIMAALTSTQYVGDTTFNFVVRVFGTFAGAVIGMVIWYIGAGQGTGSPYGIAAVSAVALPFIMYFRLQDANQPALSSVGWGWDVAWRRFVCVLIGITAAWLWAYLPPTSTQKETVRMTYAKVIGETGGVLCQVLSFANCKEDGAKPPKQIIANISALREILDLLGQLLGVFASLDSKWTKALLHRGQLSDSRFLGEVLNTFQLIATSLNDSKPLPMLFNPLLELFLRPSEAVRSGHAYGFDVTMDEPIRGIPLHVDLTTICSIEYLRFSCGISQCYAIVNRLDRLMFVAKSLVGENYIVYGLPSSEGRVGEGSEPLLRQRWLGDESARNSLEV
ncbi:hypothetical protein RQP46_001845 [Phenoliferia psychrophenolica]